MSSMCTGVPRTFAISQDLARAIRNAETSSPPGNDPANTGDDRDRVHALNFRQGTGAASARGEDIAAEEGDRTTARKFVEGSGHVDETRRLLEPRLHG